jgi:hypothetical protein
LYSTTLAENAGKLKIQILTEDVADRFRLAAGEVIRGQFSDSLLVAPEADLMLYITGTEPRANAQAIKVSVQAIIRHPFIAGNKPRILGGKLVLAEKGDVLWNYTAEQTAQAVRERIYVVISDFLQKWEQAKPQAKL